MKAIFVLFDTLNRHLLPPYGGKAIAPNFQRLAERTATFDTSYVCSMPCMPARRDILTGRPGFLHRGWGPMEPYDDSLPSLLRKAGVYSHLISDHYHYWEEGGTNYHTKYSSWEMIRGQEGDPWIGQVADPAPIEGSGLHDPKHPMIRQDNINRQQMQKVCEHPMSRVFSQACAFLERNQQADDWFLQIETFDPHEPFFSHQRYKDLYAEHYQRYKGKDYDWPPYRSVEETPEEIEHMRYQYMALLSMCDEKLGEVLDCMDRFNLWEDTMLIVGTDHGFLLGEHDCWGKCWTPFYEEVARTPFFVWDPRSGVQNERRQSLVQPAIDLAPTLLRYWGQEPTPHMTGHDLQATIQSDTPVRDTGIFGMFGSHVNITDGRYVYMRGNGAGQANKPLYEYTLMPANMRQAFPEYRLQKPLVSRTFDFTHGCHLMKIEAPGGMPGGEAMAKNFETLLFNLDKDPGQENAIQDPLIEKKFCSALQRHFAELDAPSDQYERLDLEYP